MSYNIEHADFLQWAATYDGEPFHALLCDPPYHLTSITERFGKPGSAPAQFGTDGAFARASRGFMNATWDGGDIAFRPETWAAMGKLLHPGAFGMAFASTRGFHRTAVAIENAGFIIHPMICWNFASGFPKATRLDTQIDRAAGVEPIVTGTKKHAPKWAAAEFGYREKDNGYNSRDRESFDLTEGATPLAQAWQGHRYGMQALKPAIEPIIVFQKPYQGRPVDSITRTGAGAINVDQARIATDDDNSRKKVAVQGSAPFGAGLMMGGNGHELGRWPSNLILSHSEYCNGHCVPGCPVAALGEQSGELTSGARVGGDPKVIGVFEGGWKIGGDCEASTGTAARFFFNASYALDRLEATDPLLYCPKSSTAEREAGLADFEPTTVGDGREKSIDNAYQRGETTRRNTHPTIKPISLARHLATLLLPPDMYAPRRILIPFAGAGSEMIGAMLAGWEDVQGVELEETHVDIARARLAFWQQMKYKLMNPDVPVKVQISRVPDGQTDMFTEDRDDL